MIEQRTLIGPHYTRTVTTYPAGFCPTCGQQIRYWLLPNTNASGPWVEFLDQCEHLALGGGLVFGYDWDTRITVAATIAAWMADPRSWR